MRHKAVFLIAVIVVIFIIIMIVINNQRPHKDIITTLREEKNDLIPQNMQSLPLFSFENAIDVYLSNFESMRSQMYMVTTDCVPVYWQPLVEKYNIRVISPEDVVDNPASITIILNHDGCNLTSSISIGVTEKIRSRVILVDQTFSTNFDVWWNDIEKLKNVSITFMISIRYAYDADEDLVYVMTNDGSVVSVIKKRIKSVFGNNYDEYENFCSKISSRYKNKDKGDGRLYERYFIPIGLSEKISKLIQSMESNCASLYNNEVYIRLDKKKKDDCDKILNLLEV